VAAAGGGGASAAEVETSTPYGLPISSDFPFVKKTIEIDGSAIPYVAGPNATGGYRAAPGLIGMGDSDKPGYTPEDHLRHVDGFIVA
jgi:hypothetical protein